MSIIWHNGDFREDGPVFTAHDRIRLGDGVFDTMLAVDGTLVYPDLHFERLLLHAEILGICPSSPLPTGEGDPSGTRGSGEGKDLGPSPGPPSLRYGAPPSPKGRGKWADIAQTLLEKNNFTTGRHAINTIITHGPGGRGLNPPENPDIQIVMTAVPVPLEFPPVHAIIAQSVRRNEGSPLSRIKSCNYGDNILAMMEAREKGANEAIMLNNRGHVACAAAGNIFAVINERLVTPPLSDGVLDGITRRIVIEKHGAEEKSLSPEDLLHSGGVYVTGSIRGVVPVLSLDGKTLPVANL